jgi:hypothetical protein
MPAKTSAPDRGSPLEIARRRAAAHLVRDWLLLNNWTYASVTWTGCHTSQLSNFIRCKLDPQPAFFVGLGKLNSYAAIKSHYQSVGNWTAGDFLELFCGLNRPPDDWLGSDFSPEEIKKYCRGLEILFNAVPRSGTTAELLTAVTQRVTQRLVPLTHRVITGLHTPNADEFLEVFLQLAPSWGAYCQQPMTTYSLLRACQAATDF